MLQPTFPVGFIAPCLPTKTDKLPSGSRWLHEIKRDGFRVIARKTGARVRLYSRPGDRARDLGRLAAAADKGRARFPPPNHSEQCVRVAWTSLDRSLPPRIVMGDTGEITEALAGQTTAPCFISMSSCCARCAATQNWPASGCRHASPSTGTSPAIGNGARKSEAIRKPPTPVLSGWRKHETLALARPHPHRQLVKRVHSVEMTHRRVR